MSDYNQGYRYPADSNGTNMQRQQGAYNQNPSPGGGIPAHQARQPYRAGSQQYTATVASGQQAPHRAAAQPVIPAAPADLFALGQQDTPTPKASVPRAPASPPRTAVGSAQRSAAVPTPARTAAASPSHGSPAAAKDSASARRTAPPDTLGATRQAPARSTTGGNGSGKGGGGKGSGKGGGTNGGGRRSKKSSTGKVMLKYILMVVFVLGCIGVAVASVMAVNLCQFVVESTEDDDTTLLDLEQLSGTNKNGYIMVLNPDNPNAEADDDWIEYQQLVGDSNSIWVPLEDIPEAMQHALIATEDKDFYENEKGFYIGRTIYAGLNEIFGFQNSFGASTIDQQLVKNLTGDKVVADEDGDRTAGYERKMREIYRAWSLNKNYTKDAILEAYFNTMPLTGTIVGVMAGASEYYYVEDLSQLSIAQCATIVGITNAPGRYSPYSNPENCIVRRNYILGKMLEEGYITQAEHDAAVAEELGLYTGPRQSATNTEVNSYFADEVYRAVTADYMEQEGVSQGVAHRRYYNSGWRIYCTMDLKLQQEMEQVYVQGYGDQADGYIFPESVKAKPMVNGETSTEDVPEELMVRPQSAMVVINYEGEMKGVVGGIGEKTESLGLNRATQSERQVGSTMKPIAAYALGIDGGYVDYSSLLEDSGVQPSMDNPVRGEDGELVNNWPRNYTGQGSGELIPVADALAQSLNTIAVRIGMRVGPEEMFDFLVNTLDITSLVESGDGGVTDVALAPMVLGSMTNGMTLYELAGAYQMFGNGGLYHSLHCYTRIDDYFGNMVMQPVVTVKQAISQEAAYVMNRLMENVLHTSQGTLTGRAGTANGMSPQGEMDAVGKTGTTSEDKDRWFVGLTPYYVSVTWWGYDEPQKIVWSANARTNPPAMTWKTVMEAVQADMPVKNFPEKPTGVLEQTFCRETGELATPACTDVQTGYYIDGGRVPPTCFVHGGGFAGVDTGGEGGGEGEAA